MSWHGMMLIVESLSTGASSLPDRYWHYDQIDWNQLAADVVPRWDIGGAVATAGGHDVARGPRSPSGETFWIETTRHSIRIGPAAEPTLSILRMARPVAATNECVRILHVGQPGDRLGALHLLADLAGASHLELVPRLLQDHAPDIQVWAAVLLRNLRFSGDVDDRDIEDLLHEMEVHPNPGVRTTAENIREVQIDIE